MSYFEALDPATKSPRRERYLTEDLRVEQVRLADVGHAHARLEPHPRCDLVAHAPRQLGRAGSCCSRLALGSASSGGVRAAVAELRRPAEVDQDLRVRARRDLEAAEHADLLLRVADAVHGGGVARRGTRLAAAAALLALAAFSPWIPTVLRAVRRPSVAAAPAETAARAGRVLSYLAFRPTPSMVSSRALFLAGFRFTVALFRSGRRGGCSRGTETDVSFSGAPAGSSRAEASEVRPHSYASSSRRESP